MDTVQRLDQVALFDVMTEVELAQWASKFRRERYPTGEVVVRQNERPTTFYVVDQGELQVQKEEKDKEIPLAYFHPGDFFGETGLLTGEPRNATVVVLQDAELLALDKLDFDQLMQEFPEIRDFLLALSREREEAGRTRFPWQGEDEVTIFFSTKHWMAFVHKLPLPLFTAILGIFTSGLYLSLPADAAAPWVFGVLMLLGGTLLALAVFLMIYHFLDWRNDHYVITSRRVLHIERVLLLREYRDEAPVGRVQDVQLTQGGVLANLLGYGDVIIQTAAATERVIFTTVPRPNQVQDAVFAARQHTSTQDKSEKLDAIRREMRQRLKESSDASEDQGGERTEGEPASSDEKESQTSIDPPFNLVDFLRRVGSWLRDLFTFETRILTDGGNTITWRKNGWLLFSSSLPPLFTALFVFGLALLSFVREIGAPTIGLLLLFLLLPVAGWWFYIYWDWQNDIYQISGNRLIDLKRRPLWLEESRRETTLDRVENIGLSIPGPIAQLLNYGTVVIETAGEVGAFNFEYVHDPRSVQQEIFDRMEQIKRQRQEDEERQRRTEFLDFFQVYHEEFAKKRPGTVVPPTE